MTIYHYDGRTGEYLGIGEADESPLEPGVFLLPGFATETPPPEFTAGETAAIFGGTEWAIVPDHRGESGYIDGEAVQITEPGPLPAGWSTEAPPLPEPPLPPHVSNLAFKESLIEHGILPEQVDAQLAAIPDPATRALVQLRWQQSRIALGDPVLAAQAAAFGLTDDQLAAIYRRAGDLESGY